MKLLKITHNDNEVYNFKNINLITGNTGSGKSIVLEKLNPINYSDLNINVKLEYILKHEDGRIFNYDFVISNEKINEVVKIDNKIVFDKRGMLYRGKFYQMNRNDECMFGVCNINSKHIALKLEWTDRIHNLTHTCNSYDNTVKLLTKNNNILSNDDSNIDIRNLIMNDINYIFGNEKYSINEIELLSSTSGSNLDLSLGEFNKQFQKNFDKYFYKHKYKYIRVKIKDSSYIDVDNFNNNIKKIYLTIIQLYTWNSLNKSNFIIIDDVFDGLDKQISERFFKVIYKLINQSNSQLFITSTTHDHKHLNYYGNIIRIN